MQRSTSLKLFAGLAAAAGLGFGAYEIDRSYITGPKHNSRFKMVGIPTSYQLQGDKYQDYRFFDQTGSSSTAVSLWQPDSGLEPEGYLSFVPNSHELFLATGYNRQQLKDQDSAERDLSVCTVWGYGRVGFRSDFHEFLIEGILKYTPEYNQQVRLNVDKVVCEIQTVSIDDQKFKNSLSDQFETTLFSDDSRFNYPNLLFGAK